ncbi:MAG: hypothetical protein JRN57_01235 [Nitrososphaerota archaeon]|nr:hypothetical protein [Nitrososphaerota archaeon]MDG7010718.1 hypothetical protein [Nitrososphaerota archaeon]
MSEWRSETAADLAEAGERIGAALASLSGEPSSSLLLSIWLAYVKVEKSIAFIKFDLDEENPGRFIRLKPYRVPDERQALSFALKSLKKGSDDFALGDFPQALKNLRESRNYLRALLREKRLARARRGRSS